MRMVNRWLVVLCGWSLVLSCGGSGDSGGSSGDPPPDFALPTMGDEEAPAIDDLLADDPVLEEATTTVGADGGEVSLSNGFLLSIPAGALPADTTVTVYQHPFTAAGEGGQAVYRVVSSAELSAPADLTFPIPGAPETVDPARAFVFHSYENEVGVFASSEVDATARTIRVSAPRFSKFVPTYQAAPEAPATGDKITKVPYYNQRLTENCWSMSLTMLLSAYGAPIEPWDNNAFFHLKTEHGLSWWGFANSSDIVTYITGKLPGRTVERRTWYNLDGTDDTRAYLAKNMREGRPTMVFYYSNEQGADAPHMVLFVGIEGDRFVIHDPQTRAYDRKTWDQITPRFTVHGAVGDWLLAPDGTGTLALDVAAPDTSWDATVLVPHTVNFGDGLAFGRRTSTGNGWLPDQTRSFAWYVPERGGSALIHPTTLATGGLSLDHRLFLVLGVSNLIDGGPEVEFEVGMELLQSGNVVGTPLKGMVSAAGGATVDAVLSEVSGGGREVRTLTTMEGSYTARFYVTKAGTRYDTAEIPIQIGETGNCFDLLDNADERDPDLIKFPGTMSGTVMGAATSSFSFETQLTLHAEPGEGARCNDVSLGEFPFQTGHFSASTFPSCSAQADTFHPGATVSVSLPVDMGIVACPDPADSRGYSYADPTSGTVTITIGPECDSATVTVSLTAAGDTSSCQIEASLSGTRMPNP